MIFGARRPKLTREQSLAAYPLLNDLVKYEESEKGEILLHVPLKATGVTRLVARLFRLPMERRIALDELGSWVVRRCNGELTVKQIIDLFSKEYKLNVREAEVATIQYLRMLGKRRLIALAVPRDAEAARAHLRRLADAPPARKARRRRKR